jgi:exosortase family protein XrtF
MAAVSLREFKPTILFLAKFLGIYIVGNLLYGWYITAYRPKVDPVTHWVTVQTTDILSACGWSSSVQDSRERPYTALVHDGKIVLSVFEGCNGLNTIIIFIAFIAAFGPYTKAMFWFVPTGLLIIHVVNLARIGLLFFVAEYQPDFMYFTHKYFFTAILYIIIFLLWMIWVKRFSLRKL